MRTQSTSEQDSSFSITPAVRPRMPWRVVKVKALPAYQLQVDFIDGVQGVVDMSALVHSPTAGVFAELADPARFANVFVELGAVTWPGEIDLVPDAMHAAIKLTGKWVLG
jgi:hypothetical protein